MAGYAANRCGRRHVLCVAGFGAYRNFGVSMCRESITRQERVKSDQSRLGSVRGLGTRLLRPRVVSQSSLGHARGASRVRAHTPSRRFRTAPSVSTSRERGRVTSSAPHGLLRHRQLARHRAQRHPRHQYGTTRQDDALGDGLAIGQGAPGLPLTCDPRPGMRPYACPEKSFPLTTTAASTS